MSLIIWPNICSSQTFHIRNGRVYFTGLLHSIINRNANRMDRMGQPMGAIQSHSESFRPVFIICSNCIACNKLEPHSTPYPSARLNNRSCLMHSIIGCIDPGTDTTRSLGGCRHRRRLRWLNIYWLSKLIIKLRIWIDVRRGSTPIRGPPTLSNCIPKMSQFQATPVSAQRQLNSIQNGQKSILFTSHNGIAHTRGPSNWFMIGQVFFIVRKKLQSIAS